MWSIDADANAAYLTLTDKPVARTVQAGPVNVDLDAQGEAVGVEFMGGVLPRQSAGVFTA